MEYPAFGKFTKFRYRAQRVAQLVESLFSMRLICYDLTRNLARYFKVLPSQRAFSPKFLTLVVL